MATGLPLSTPLSQALIAYTIEVDNELERQMAPPGPSGGFRVSLVMWSNFMRFIPEEGVPIRELVALAGVTKTSTRSTLGGMERWGYVVAGPADGPPQPMRQGRGSARGLRDGRSTSSGGR